MQHTRLWIALAISTASCAWQNGSQIEPPAAASTTGAETPVEVVVSDSESNPPADDQTDERNGAEDTASADPEGPVDPMVAAEAGVEAAQALIDTRKAELDAATATRKEAHAALKDAEKQEREASRALRHAQKEFRSAQSNLKKEQKAVAVAKRKAEWEAKLAAAEAERQKRAAKREAEKAAREAEKAAKRAAAAAKDAAAKEAAVRDGGRGAVAMVGNVAGETVGGMLERKVW